MPRIYVSSTYEDLKEYREAVYRALSKIREAKVIAMEDYVAQDRRPLQTCLEDVASCDVYVGIFAWRYGYIPDDKKDNPERMSITELEYRKTRVKGIPCLVFLVDENIKWSPKHIDGTPQSGVKSNESINRLREELWKNHSVIFFRSPDQLAVDVLAAINQHLLEIEANKVARVYNNEKVIEWSEKFMDKVEKKMDICFDQYTPHFVVTGDPYKKGYKKIREQRAKIRAITEIREDNLADCKELKDMVDELRHLDGVEGGMAVSKDQYMTATTSLLQHDLLSTRTIESQMSEAVYSERPEVVRHNQCIFNTLWKNATPADKRFSELEGKKRKSN